MVIFGVAVVAVAILLGRVNDGGWSGAALGKSLGAERRFVLLAFTLDAVSQSQSIDTKVSHRPNLSLNLNLLDCSDDQA